MQGQAAVVFLAVSLAAGAIPSGSDQAAKEEAVKKDLKALKGTWKPVSAEFDGKEVPEEDLEGRVATVEEAGKEGGKETGKATARKDGMVVAVGTFEIDPTKKPKTMDYTSTEGEDKGKTSLAIYEIDGDTLRICFGPPEGKRPTEFSAKPGSGRLLRTYKRE
jgi:uncharacterized protein (TIGR03067 family)